MSADAPIRVVVADDSRTARALLVALLEAEPSLTVVGEAADGAEALELTGRLRPSVVVMDIEMPRMDGFEATKRIMIEHPTPIVIVTARHDVHHVEVALQAMRAGALTVAAKPGGRALTTASDESARRLVMLVKALADVKVVRRRSGGGELLREADRLTAPRGHTVEAVAVAASTGGPVALYRFLEAMPRSLDVPVLVVQHMADGFVEGLARWLGTATVLPVCVAQDGAELRGGQVYIAPDDHHLEVARGRIQLSGTPPVGGFRPSANVLFTSLADAYGATAAAVVLTGMGEDGVVGAARVREGGGLVLAQDAETSAVYGMPRAVVTAGLADAVGPVEDLAYRVVRSASKRKSWR